MNSISNHDSYKNICRLASLDENTFNTFKTNHAYNAILEHVSIDQGGQYLEYLNANYPEYKEHLDKFKQNDTLGGSKMYEYGGIGNISPSTLRYIKVLFDLVKLFGDLNNKKIIEIGVGYGGQCFVLSQLFPNVQKYALVDLDEALLLSGKYLNKLSTRHEVVTIDNLESLNEEFDLVISNYAYSELRRDLQDYYYDKIINKSKHGYFTLNFISHLFNIDSYSFEDTKEKFKEKNFSLMEEYPKTSDNNIILYY